MTQLYVSPVTQVVASPAGPSARFEAGVPRPVREALVPFAMAAGIRRAEDIAVQTPEVTTPQGAAPSVEEIAEAIRTIMGRGNTSDFTAAGLIRMNVLEKEVGHDISAEDRDAAMALVEAVNGDD